MLWLRRIVAFLVAIVATTLLGCVASTHFVLLALAELDVAIGFGDRWRVYGHDLAGMAPLLAAIVAVAFVIAFPIAALGARFVPRVRTWGYVAAGAAAVLVALMSMEAALAVMPVAGARTPWGLASQGVAGAIGGGLFALLSRANGTPARR